MGFDNLQAVTQADANAAAGSGATIPWTQLTNQSAANPYDRLYPSTSPFPFCASCTDSTQYIGVLRAGSDHRHPGEEPRVGGLPGSLDGARGGLVPADAAGDVPENDQQQFVGIFTRATGPSDAANAADLQNVTSWAQLNTAISQQYGAGRRLVDVVTYLDAGTRHFVGVFRPGSDAQVVVNALGGDALNQQWATLSGQSLRLTNLTSYDAGGGQRQYIGVFRAGTDGYALWSGMNWSSFTAEWATLRAEGLRLVDIETFPVGGQREYMGVFRAGSDGDALFSITGYANYIQQEEYWGSVGVRSVDLQVEQQN